MHRVPIALAAAATLALLAPPLHSASAAPVTGAAVTVSVLSVPMVTLAATPAVGDTEIPPPPPPPLPFVREVRVCPQADCSREICPGDSIQVNLVGSFPNDCYHVCEVRLFYPPIESPRPLPPWVVLVVTDGREIMPPCVDLPSPWRATTTLGPLPQGRYDLTVAMVLGHCGETLPPPDDWQRMLVPFYVLPCDTTPPPHDCFLGQWLHPGPTRCDAEISRGEAAHVTFTLRTTIALAGLQGAFLVQPPGLKITEMKPIGPAEGMRLAWAPTEGGARFVMFTAGGEPIPPTDPSSPAAQILELTLVPSPDLPIPPATLVTSYDLLGSDVDGHGIPPCAVVTTMQPPSTTDVAIEAALICATVACDVNHDGLNDIRDIVMLVHCFYSRQECPGYDCNADGRFDFDDVMCCAMKILKAPDCPNPNDCPPDTTAPQRDDSVHVSVGLPVDAPDGIRVPIRIDGAARLGAARLAMRFPADRYRVVSLDSNDGGWLTLATAQDGEARMGVICIDRSEVLRIGPLELSLRLERAEGQPGGGELGSLHGDFSSPEGRRLLVQVSGPTRPLPGGATFELSENRPDPFAGETRFTLTLPRAASVDLGVFDINGRRLATLHRGAAPAGVSEYSWNGRMDAGGRARGGVYFYRALIEGQSVSRKMVLIDNGD